jgi:hypothetical protein
MATRSVFADRKEARPDRAPRGRVMAHYFRLKVEIVEAVKRAIPDASSQPLGAVLQYAKNVAGLVLAVLTIVLGEVTKEASRESLASTNGATVQITRLTWLPLGRLADFSYV